MLRDFAGREGAHDLVGARIDLGDRPGLRVRNVDHWERALRGRSKLVGAGECIDVHADVLPGMRRQRSVTGIGFTFAGRQSRDDKQ